MVLFVVCIECDGRPGWADDTKDSLTLGLMRSLSKPLMIDEPARGRSGWGESSGGICGGGGDRVCICYQIEYIRKGTRWREEVKWK